MKIYIITDRPYHDNEGYYGAYTTKEKAREAIAAFAGDDTRPEIIVEIPVDEPADTSGIVWENVKEGVPRAQFHSPDTDPVGLV